MSDANKQLKATIIMPKPKVPPANGNGSSAAGAASEEKTRQTQAEKLLDLAADIFLFHDQNGDGYAFYNGECVKLSSKKMQKVLSHLMYRSTGKTPNKEAISQAISALEGKAIFDCDKIHLENRVAMHLGKILYDLGNQFTVRITKHGWEIIKSTPKFRRYNHQAVQVYPAKSGGDVYALFKFINVSPKHRLLVLVTLISYFISGIAHPIFHPWGPQGSGKTSLFRLFKKLVDPSIVETLMCSSDRTRVIHALVTHYMPLFDNLSRLDGETSDILCQACTGGGIEQRQLFTDSDSIIFLILRCVGINGINLSIAKPDLLDRTLLLHLDRIPPNERREESVLWAEFEIARPYILGGIFDILSKAIAIYPTVKLEKLPRLADYGRWGYAIAEAIKPGLGKQFVADYEQNVQQQVDEAIQSNTLATTLLMYLSKRADNEWVSTITTAFTVLKTFADPDRYDKSFPMVPRDLRRHLERLKTTLEERGITYSIQARTSDGYPIIFRKTAGFSSFAASSSSETPVNAVNELNAAKLAISEVSQFNGVL